MTNVIKADLLKKFRSRQVDNSERQRRFQQCHPAQSHV